MYLLLDEVEPRLIGINLPEGFAQIGLVSGEGALSLELLLLEAEREPSNQQVKDIWRRRSSGRAAPLIVAVYVGETVVVCGPAGEDPPVRRNLDRAQADRLFLRAWKQPDRHAALRFLNDALPALESKLPGVRNEGLLSFHVLAKRANGCSEREWETAIARARAVLGRQGEDLLKGLGFRLDPLGRVAKVLLTGDRRRAVAVLLDQSETPEGGAARFQFHSPLTHAMDLALEHNLPWVVLVKDGTVRLCPTDLTVGVGRRGLVTTFVELDTDLMREADIGLLWLLMSSDALSPGGSLEKLLADSREFADDLAVRLRERIYDVVVPKLAAGVVQGRAIDKPTVDDLRLNYEMALTVLFRLLFIAYAEDRGFLPYRRNDAYDHRALKTKAKELAEAAEAPFAGGDDLWREAQILFDAIANGNPRLGVPQYNGGLFTSDAAVSRAGAELARIGIDNTFFGPALRALLTIEAPEEEGRCGPVDFRTLGVREFGTIYEGLLESELAVADRDLALKLEKKSWVYVPAQSGGRGQTAKVAVRKGEVYLHNRSGARKVSGSYFTPAFAVDHLLDEALEPALEAHLARLDALDEAEAADAFFDLRVADIAMGSGHFLVSAVDRIERALSRYLTRRNLPGVRRELDRLREAAEGELKRVGVPPPVIEDMVLLRRLVARRCVYGVDVNLLSVQLARLSIWIHTFVPGLPLSLLDHTLVQGNALVGIATIDQLKERFRDAGLPLFPVDAESLLGAAREPLQRLARLADATPRDVAAGRAAMEEARRLAGEARALFDIVVAEKVAPGRIAFQYETWNAARHTIEAHPARATAAEVLEGLNVFHFPERFPEVFLRDHPGFDVILGNPPWEKVKVEEHAFWARHFPGLRGLTQTDRESELRRLRKARPDLIKDYLEEVEQANRERAVLTAGFYPGMGTGDPDLYKAFFWRFWQLASSASGRIAVVLPRSALSAKGGAVLRRIMFSEARKVSVATFVNKGTWFFKIHPQYTMGLCVFEKGAPLEHSIILQGPYSSFAAYQSGRLRRHPAFQREAVLSWTDSASLPLLPTELSIDVFVQLRKSPGLDLNVPGTWRARPDRELDATLDKELMEFGVCENADWWPVFKGESFDIWEPDRGEYYAWANPGKVKKHLQEKRLRSAKRITDSVHREYPLAHVRDARTLSCLYPRIAFRDVSRATDSRTVRAALVPAKVFLTHKAPFFHWPRGDERDQAYLLGVLCSLPLDWYARRFVEANLTYFILNPFPIPRPKRTDTLWERAVAIAGRLAAPDERFAEWAGAVGVEWGPLPPDAKRELIEELDAVVARLYGLTEAQLVHIFETFHEGWDYEERLRRTLKHFRKAEGRA